MATGSMDRTRIHLLWLAAVISPLIPATLVPEAQSQEEPAPRAADGFPNGGLLGGNPFGPSPEERAKAKRDADDWSSRRRNADKCLGEALNCGREDKCEEALAWAEGAVRCDPEYVAAHAARGKFFLALKHYARAIEDFDVALKKEPRRKEL